MIASSVLKLRRCLTLFYVSLPCLAGLVAEINKTVKTVKLSTGVIKIQFLLLTFRVPMQTFFLRR